MDYEKMQNDVIRKFGLEADETLTFCHLCERPHSLWNDSIIWDTYQILMNVTIRA